MAESKLPFSCWFCCHEWTDEEQFEDHMEKLPCVCVVCGAITYCKYHMKTHMERSNIYKCPYCPMKSVVRKTFLSHVASHNYKDFQCVVCADTFNSVVLLIHHMRKHRR